MTLAEDPNLELPFLIPEQGYSCDTMRGLPMGLEEYLEQPINAGTVYHENFVGTNFVFCPKKFIVICRLICAILNYYYQLSTRVQLFLRDNNCAICVSFANLSPCKMSMQTMLYGLYKCLCCETYTWNF